MSKKIQLFVSGKEITVNPIKVKQVKSTLKIADEVEQSIALISASTGMSTLEIDELDLRDFAELQEAVKPFLLAGKH